MVEVTWPQELVSYADRKYSALPHTLLAKPPSPLMVIIIKYNMVHHHQVQQVPSQLEPEQHPTITILDRSGGTIISTTASLILVINIMAAA